MVIFLISSACYTFPYQPLQKRKIHSNSPISFIDCGTGEKRWFLIYSGNTNLTLKLSHHLHVLILHTMIKRLRVFLVRFPNKKLISHIQ